MTDVSPGAAPADLGAAAPEAGKQGSQSPGAARQASIESGLPQSTRTVTWLPYRWGPSPIHGHGVFARQAIAKGELIGEYKGPETEENDVYVLWVEDEDELSARNGENGLRFLNHSRSPNAEFDGYELFALRDIEVDEEITFDYGDESLDFF